MKLPEDLGKKLDTIRWRIDIGNEATRLACYEAIVRDCTDAFIRLLGDSPQAKRAAIAVLHRYDLVAEPNAAAAQVSGNETGMPNGSVYPVPASAAAPIDRRGIPLQQQNFIDHSAPAAAPNPYLEMLAGNHTVGIIKNGKLIATDSDVYALTAEREPNAAATQPPSRLDFEKSGSSGALSAPAAAPCIAGQFASGLKTWAVKP